MGVCPSFNDVFTNSNDTSGTSHTTTRTGLSNFTNYCFNTTACDSSDNCASANFSFFTAQNLPVDESEDNNISTNISLFLDNTEGDITRTYDHSFNTYYYENSSTSVIFLRNTTTISNNSLQELGVGFYRFNATIYTNDSHKGSHVSYSATIT